MKSKARYRIEYFTKSLLIFREGLSLRDKALLIPYGLIRVTALTLIGSRIFSHHLNIKIERLTFPFFDVKLKNQYGLFHCRKRSGDLWICQEAYELDETEYINNKVEEGLFIDIGANVGRYTVMAARKMKEKGEVIAIEPEPDNFAALIKNIELNKLTRIRAFCVAATSSDESIRLFINPNDTGGHSVINQTSNGYDFIIVKGLKLDTILRDLLHLDVKLIKIDAEGATPEVLIGAEETIASNTDLRILFEHYNDTHFERSCEILRKHGFTVRPMTSFSYNFVATRKTSILYEERGKHAY